MYSNAKVSYRFINSKHNHARITVKGHSRPSIITAIVRAYATSINKCKKLRFRQELTANNTSKTAKITKR